jgi:hypothetical protein
VREEEEKPDKKFYSKFGRKVDYSEIAELAEAYRDFVDRQGRENMVGSHVPRIDDQGREV